jgi:hypothetical protein
MPLGATRPKEMPRLLSGAKPIPDAYGCEDRKVWPLCMPLPVRKRALVRRVAQAVGSNNCRILVLVERDDLSNLKVQIVTPKNYAKVTITVILSEV